MSGELAFTGGGPLGDTVVPPPAGAPPAAGAVRTNSAARTLWYKCDEARLAATLVNSGTGAAMPLTGAANNPLTSNFVPGVPSLFGNGVLLRGTGGTNGAAHAASAGTVNDFHGASNASIWALIKPYAMIAGDSTVWGQNFAGPGTPVFTVGISTSGRPTFTVRLAGGGLTTITGLNIIPSTGVPILIAGVLSAAGTMSLYVNGQFEVSLATTPGDTIDHVAAGALAQWWVGSNAGVAPSQCPTMVAIDVGADLSAMTAANFDAMYRGLALP